MMPGSASNPRPWRSATRTRPFLFVVYAAAAALWAAAGFAAGLGVAVLDWRSPLPLPSFCGRRRGWTPTTRPIASRKFRSNRGAGWMLFAGIVAGHFSDAMDPAAFVRRNTVIAAPPLVPEIRLHLATEVTPIWLATEESLARDGAAAAVLGFRLGRRPGAGALSARPARRWSPAATCSISASGSGLVAIAAAKAGAARVVAAEIDPFAAAAIAANAALNNVDDRDDRRATCLTVIDDGWGRS